MASRATSGEPVAEPRLGLIVVARRGRGRQWQLVAETGAGWKLQPLGGDVGSWTGVKPRLATEEQLRENWVVA